MNRSEHLQWCKDRAMEYIGVGDTSNAVASFVSDMSKHPETESHSALPLMSAMLFSGNLSTPQETEKFILGFN